MRLYYKPDLLLRDRETTEPPLAAVIQIVYLDEVCKLLGDLILKLFSNEECVFDSTLNHWYNIVLMFYSFSAETLEE